MTTFISTSQIATDPKYYEFFNRKSFVDVTIFADEHEVHAHKIILAASSSYFEKIFAAIPDKHPAVILYDVTKTQLNNLMEFIYNGKVDVDEDDTEDFKKLLKKLKIGTKFSEIPGKTNNEIDKMTEEIFIKEEKESHSEIVQMKTEDFQNSSNEVISFLSLPKQPQPNMKNKIFVKDVVKCKEAKILMNENPKDCPFCMKTSLTSYHRNRHVKYCRMNPDRVITICPHCDKSLCSPESLRNHVKFKHPDKKYSNLKNIFDKYPFYS